MLFKKKNKSLFTIEFLDDNSYNINIYKNISNDNLLKVANFIYLLTYNSPIAIDIIDKIKQNTDIDKNSIDIIINSWATIYLNNKDIPMISPLNAFKQNVK